MRQDRRASLLKAAGVDVAGLAITYTGTKTDQIVTMSGVAYRLLTLITSGTLTVPKKVSADVWMCGGGSGGNGYNNNPYCAGGGGAGSFAKMVSVMLSTENIAVVGAGSAGAGQTHIAEHGGISSFNSISVDPMTYSTAETNTGKGNNGGSGGGKAWSLESTAGSGLGDSVSKIIFGEADLFPLIPCAGGAGGQYRSESGKVNQSGGTGGSNGGNGGAPQSGLVSGGVDGGVYGGGRSGDTSSYYRGCDAFFYGSGGGGAGINFYSLIEGERGAGYQGVIYVRIPIAQ